MTDNRLVIFDMDGVLIDSEKFYMKSEQRVVESFGKKASIRDFRKYCGMTQINIWSEIKSDFDLSESVDELKVQGKESLEYLFETEPIELISGVLETLKGLKEGNVPMAVASSTGKKLILEHLTQPGIKDYFSLIKSAEEVGASKPVKHATFPKYEYFKADEDYADIARILGLKGNTTQELVDSLVQSIIDLGKSVGIDMSLKSQGVTQEVLDSTVDRMAELAFEDQCTTANPKEPLISELKQIIIDAYEGV